MKSKPIIKIIFAAMFASLVCVTTMIFPIPSPLGGYVNAGDCFVLLSGFLLGPIYGFCAAGIGSMLCDLFLGYTVYAPATFIIKGFVALIAALLFIVLKKLFKNYTIVSRIISGTIGEIFMVMAYFLFECFLLGYGMPAASNIPGNIIQALTGIVGSVLLLEMINRSGVTKRWFGNEAKLC